jgi:hypothetical protein
MGSFHSGGEFGAWEQIAANPQDGKVTRLYLTGLLYHVVKVIDTGIVAVHSSP